MNTTRHTREDDYREASITVVVDEGGDVGLIVSSGPRSAGVTFCSKAGGGRSLRTRAALLELARAIDEDTKERP